MRKATDQQIIEAYAATKSVWASARLLGLCGQSVQERLVRLGVPRSHIKFSPENDRRLLRDYNAYTDSGRLWLLAQEMGRTKQFLCRQAKRLGLSSYRRKDCEDELMRQSDRMIAVWANKSKEERAAQAMKIKVGWKQGWREIGGQRAFFRSAWEANYARYLEWLKQNNKICSWEHEPETFWFLEIKRGSRSYLPDFKVSELNGSISYHEVKGWLTQQGKTKLKRMKKYYPDIKMFLIRKKEYISIRDKVSRLIPGWE